jgi:hypothetical protein
VFELVISTEPTWERRVRTLGAFPLAAELRRIAAARVGTAEGTETADVVVHRGWVPFVGSGQLVTDQTLSCPWSLPTS